MYEYRPVVALSCLFAFAACADPLPTRPLPTSTPLFAKPAPNAAATWKFPLADAALSVVSDHQNNDGIYSLYQDGVCSVNTTIFNGGSGSGDAMINFTYPQTRGRGTCGRTWTLRYPDSWTETLAFAGGVQVLQNVGYSIPIGSTVLRHFRFGADQSAQKNPVAARCGLGLVFGPNGANPAAGSDSVMVTRVDASTWQVQSQAAPNDHAYCIDNGQLYEMQVSFVIVSSQPLP